jgi:hypothetical protein
MSNVTRFRGAAAVVMATALTLATVASPRDAFGQAATTQPTTRPAATAVSTTQPSAPMVRVVANDTTKAAPTIAPIVDRGPHRVEQGQNFKIIRMHNPRSMDDAVSGPSQMAMNEGAGKIIILNYTDRSNPESMKQIRWIEEALPALAQRSTKPIVLIDITAFDKNASTNVIDMGFSYSLVGYLERFNTLGQNGERMPFNVKTDPLIVPYGALIYGGPGNKGVYEDFSASLYPAGSTDTQIRGAVLSNILRAVKTSNAQLAQNTLPTSGTMAAVITPGQP